MRFYGLILAVTLVSLTTGFASFAGTGKWHPDISTIENGDLFRTSVDQLHPGQFAVGRAEVNRQVLRLSKLNKKERNLEAKEEPVLVVIGPQDKLYVVDGHHQAAARLAIGHPHLYAKAIQDWRKLDPKIFWQKMIDNNYVYLFDENGQGPHFPDELPSRIADMKDDPYRSLAGFVRRRGGFEKSEEPFNEFKWAQYFRSDLHLDPSTSSEMITSETMIQSATVHAKSSDAEKVNVFAIHHSSDFLNCEEAFPSAD